jgi:hypothetical protein
MLLQVQLRSIEQLLDPDFLAALATQALEMQASSGKLANHCLGAETSTIMEDKDCSSVDDDAAIAAELQKVFEEANAEERAASGEHATRAASVEADAALAAELQRSFDELGRARSAVAAAREAAAWKRSTQQEFMSPATRVSTQQEFTGRAMRVSPLSRDDWPSLPPEAWPALPSVAPWQKRAPRGSRPRTVPSGDVRVLNVCQGVEQHQELPQVTHAARAPPLPRRKSDCP